MDQVNHPCHPATPNIAKSYPSPSLSFAVLLRDGNKFRDGSYSFSGPTVSPLSPNLLPTVPRLSWGTSAPQTPVCTTARPQGPGGSPRPPPYRFRCHPECRLHTLQCPGDVSPGGRLHGAAQPGDWAGQAGGGQLPRPRGAQAEGCLVQVSHVAGQPSLSLSPSLPLPSSLSAPL